MATREQIGAALQAAHAAGDTENARILAQAYRDYSEPAQPEVPQPINPTDGMSDYDKLMSGVGMGMTNTARGAGQRLRSVLPESVSNKLGLPTESDIEESRKLDKALLDTGIGKAGNFVGSTASTAFVPGGTIAKSLLGGALAGGLAPTTADESVLKNMTEGAAGGLLGHGAVSGAGRLLRPVRSELTPELAALAKKAQDSGIELNAAQLTGSKPLKWIDSVMNDLPLTAGAQQAQQEAQRKQFNAAVAKTFSANSDKLTEDVMQAAKNDIGGAIGDLAKNNSFKLDNQSFTDLVKNKFDAQRFETADVKNIVNNTIDDFFSKVQPDGTVSGEAYRKLDSKLGQRMRGTTNGDLKHALGEVRDSLREGMDRSISPEDSSTWQNLRRQYANMKTVEPVIAKSTDGNINPNLLLGAALKADKNAAYRTSDLKDLGKIGKEFLKEQPSSGTAQRQFYQKMLTTGGLGAGGAGTGFLLGGPIGAGTGAAISGLLSSGALAIPIQKAMNSKAGKKYLTEGLLKSAQGLEDPLLKYLATPAGAQGLLLSLNNQ